MQRTLSIDLPLKKGEQVFILGWIHTIRSLGKLSFLIVRDRKGLVQVVLEEKNHPVSLLHPGSVISVVATVKETLESNLGVELIHPTIEIISPIQEVSPIEYNKPEIPSDLEFILDHRPLALRNQKIQAVFIIQAEIAHAFRSFMHDQVGAVEYFAPNILGTSSEGGAEFFTVDYFGYTATLAQSSQLYKQIMVGSCERVFALMPFFRAEPSQTSRHLSEGKQFEFEMGFFRNWHEILDIQELCIKSIVEHLQSHCKKELELLGNPLIAAPRNVPFPRISFQEAQNLYFQRTGIDERKENDLSPAAERDLSLYAKETYGTDLIFITDWKTEKRPFYAYPKEENKHLTNTFDLLCAGTEITSGGQRRDSYQSMIEGIQLKGMDPSNFSDYLSIFKYGMPPHGGFGMGLERLTMTLLRLHNIREASLFPSDKKRIAGVRIKAKIFFGAENIRNEIIRLLKEQEIPFHHQIHTPAATSEESALARTTRIEQGIKALILRGKNTKKNYQFNLLAHQKLDMKLVSAITGEKCEFEEASVILERFGLTVGGIPPFGNLLNVETYFDESISSQAEISFNCGLLTESISMSSKELINITTPKIASFSKKE